MNRSVMIRVENVSKSFSNRGKSEKVLHHVSFDMNKGENLSAVLIAIGLGLILGRIRTLWDIVDPIVQVLRPVSPIAWTPFIVLWFGIGDIPAIVIIFIAAFFPVLLSTITAVKKVDQIYLKVAQNLEIPSSLLLVGKQWGISPPANLKK